jgi:hypothetical protein
MNLAWRCISLFIVVQARSEAVAFLLLLFFSEPHGEGGERLAQSRCSEFWGTQVLPKTKWNIYDLLCCIPSPKLSHTRAVFLILYINTSSVQNCKSFRLFKVIGFATHLDINYVWMHREAMYVEKSEWLTFGTREAYLKSQNTYSTLFTVISLTYVVCIVGLGSISPHLIVLITFIFIAWHCHLSPGKVRLILRSSEL